MGVITRLRPWQISLLLGLLAALVGLVKYGIGVFPSWIYMYDLSNLHLVHTIEEIPNIGGVCALAACAGRQPVPL